MRVGECLDLLGGSLAALSITAPEGTPLHRCAGAVREMAAAYEKDGRTFLGAGDPVNALASAWYGFGWLHFGTCCGLLASGQPPACPFVTSCQPLPSGSEEKLSGKAHRYAQLLGTARKSVEYAAEPETAGWLFAGQVSLIVKTYADRGDALLSCGRQEDALACFSYGHGWLDAAVVAGLFSITAHRDLFTV